MNIAGFSFGVVGLAAQLFKTSTECYDIFSDAQSFSVGHDGLAWHVKTEQARLLRWENAWGVSSSTLDQKLDPGDYRYRYAVGTLAWIVALFASVDTLNTKYGVRVDTKNSTPPGTPIAGQNQGSPAVPRRRDKISTVLVRLRLRVGFLKTSSNAATASGASSSGLTPSSLDPNSVNILQNPMLLENKALVPGLDEEITRIGETTAELQKIRPYYRKLQWAITDKSKFSGLIEELRKYNDRLFSVLPDPGPLQPQHPTPPPFPRFNVPVRLPVQRNKQFVGRVDLLDRLHKILTPAPGQNNRERRVAVLHGLGGMGKSQIVTEYAYRYSPSYTSVFWIDATSQTTLARSSVGMIEQLVSHYQTKWLDSTPDFTEIGEKLGLPGLIKSTGQVRDGYPQELVSRAVKKWLSSVGNDGWLVVFDNHDDIETVKTLDFFPTCDFGSIIITTRRPEVKHLGVGVEVGEIEKQAGISILLSSASKDPQITSGADYEEASKTAERLGYLPLALDQAGGYISAMQMPLVKYLPLYSASFKLVASANHPGISERYRSDTLFTTWKISFDSLPPYGSNLLYLCAFITNGGQEIPQELFDRAKGNICWLGNDSPFIHDGLKSLLSLSLAKQKNRHGDISICFHPLVLEWTREILDKREQQNFVKRALALLVGSLQFQSSELARSTLDWDFERRILPIVEISLQNLRNFSNSSGLDADVGAMECMAVVGNFLTRNTRYEQAEEIIRMSLKCHQGISGNQGLAAQTPIGLTAIADLGWILNRKGCYDKALELLELALVGLEKVSGKDDPNTLMVMGRIAWVLSSINQHREALEMQEQVLAGYERANGKEHPSTLAAMRCVGCILDNQGRYTESLELYKRALAVQERVLGKDHPDTHRTIVRIAKAIQLQGPERRHEALELYRSVLTKQGDLLGPEHSETLTTVYSIAHIYQLDGRYKEALELYQRVVVGERKLIGTEHPYILGVSSDIAATYQQDGKYQEALEIYQRILPGVEKAMGTESFDAWSVMNNMGLCFQAQGRYQEAADSHRRALSIQEKVLGGEHFETLRTIHYMAVSFQAQGKLEESYLWYGRTVAGHEKVFGKEHSETLRLTHNMGTILLQQGKGQEALDLWEKVIVGQEQALDKNNPDLLRTIVSMAMATQALGRYTEALELFKRAFDCQLETLGPQHQETLRTIHYMATAKHQQGKIEEALELFQRALEGQEEVFGKEHFDTLITITSMAGFFHTQGRHQEAANLYRRVLAGWKNLFGPDNSWTISAAIELSVVEGKIQ